MPAIFILPHRQPSTEFSTNPCPCASSPGLSVDFPAPSWSQQQRYHSDDMRVHFHKGQRLPIQHLTVKAQNLHKEDYQDCLMERLWAKTCMFLRWISTWLERWLHATSSQEAGMRFHWDFFHLFTPASSSVFIASIQRTTLTEQKARKADGFMGGNKTACICTR